MVLQAGTIVAVGAEATTTTQALVLNLPSVPGGYRAGDVVTIAVRCQASSGGSAPYFSAPGFTNVTPSYTVDATYRAAAVLVMKVTDPGSVPATVTVTSNLASGQRVVGLSFVQRGTNGDDPVLGLSLYAGTTITNGRRAASFATSADPYLLVFIGASEFAANNTHVPVTTPAGLSLVGAAVSSENVTTSRTYLHVAAAPISDGSTATPDLDIAWGVPSGQNAFAIAFRGGEEVEPIPDGWPVKLGDGSDARVLVTGPEDTLINPVSVRNMNPGFDSVAQMLATPGFTVAHRGSSTRYPEMSLHAYTQAVRWGYGALECSLACTTDGVWYGAHDQYLDRVALGSGDGSTGTLPANGLTWAQVQALSNITGVQGTPAPFMRLEELFEAYGDTHVLMLDPKYQHSTKRAEFLDILASLDGRGIAKYHVSNPSLANACAARGLPIWGYAYEADLSNGSWATWMAGAWTVLGMEYTASQGSWDTVLAQGKPVIGHIAPDQSAYATAISKGADGVQCSATQLIAAVSV